MELHELGAAELAEGYRAKAFRPLEVVDALLGRIEAAGREIDAFATVTADLARAQALEAERALGGGDPRPLLGIPVALKDLIDTAGVATEAGSRVFAGRTPPADAPAWAALRAAGCVLIGKARTHEFAFGSSTPPTRNPWDLTRMPGGSSGGSAAALSAGLVPLAMGTDTGGSIRIPSGLCGTVGFKPTYQLVPPVGVVPLSWTLDHVGPMARSPHDCGLLLSAIIPGGGSPADRGSLAGTRVGVLSNPGPLSPGVAAAVETARRCLEEAGAHLDEVSIPAFEECVDVDFTIIGAEAAFYHRPWFAERRNDYTAEVAPRVASGFDIGTDRYLEARRRAERYRDTFVAALRERRFLLLAGMPATAPLLGAAELRMGEVLDQLDHALCRNTAFANLTGLPALALPAGLEEGLPVGVQIAGRHFDDWAVLEAGQTLWEMLQPPRLATFP